MEAAWVETAALFHTQRGRFYHHSVESVINCLLLLDVLFVILLLPFTIEFPGLFLHCDFLGMHGVKIVKGCSNWRWMITGLKSKSDINL
ncbi:hypothetical protein Nepgr_018189 [Nepenthes gracilis]|uniref:Uncharacterized protein n=1 Tax=Nepenthes gracilis TaxID=150966 RepID=A0AAD3XT84_NEPGR|nr:hypothetical protein Nepgr_018189 [Nepenthes gracilis]